ncbi:unnamed protein product [Diatraea saccharalis]|uniref:RHD domain-containing protein n=1 Tax=Diatraea saccharalis TaxID=40085 RepID=A0A9N9RCU6_9NEOP|nr:unnamed protein product [Diatraea saccharalis]
MSASDDTESYYIESPLSQSDSPYSSPSQQVPQLATSMIGLSCTDGRPYLRIVEQPQSHFRFRYKSEMVGTHGCLLGESYANSKTKTHPTVELVNYSGRAVIRCRLSQHKTPDEHPHKLLEEEQDRDVSYGVPEHGSYKVGFAGMGIIHTAKKDVPALLYKKYSEAVGNARVNPKELSVFCENEAKAINLNIVRLRFSAHDIITDKEICPPVFSRPIYNMKCAATNDLKICRISRICGRASGGDDVFLLVEKVNKKNITVRLYELNENGEEVWSAPGNFLQNDVHHQYAIVFRTPPYQDKNTPVDKKVFIELVRPSDGRTSEPKDFCYKAAPAYKFNKKRKVNSAFSSYNSTESSLKSTSDIPATVLLLDQKNEQHEEDLKNVNIFNIPQIPQIPMSSPLSSSDLGEALYGIQTEGSPSESTFYDSPMLPQSMVEPPDLQLNSTELERILKDNASIPAEEKEQFCNTDWSEYLKSYTDSLSEENNSFRMDIIRSMLTTDSGRPMKTEASPSKPNKFEVKQENSDSTPTKSNIDKIKNSTEYSAFYTAEDGMEVKKLVKELCEMIRMKTGIQKKQIVRSKLDKLFEMRLSNGDTFLHMTLCSKEPSLEYIVKLIHSMKMTNLLNLTNNQSQTILHLAVIHDMPNVIPLLVEKGCDPMIEDAEGNNVIHNAVIYQSCLEPLLTALKRSSVPFNINAYNNEKQTALHLAVIHKSAASVRQLMRNGASNNVRDSGGRTPLHLAAYDDCVDVARELLEYVAPSEINALDERGYTALQVACDGVVKENTLDIVKLLLLKKADPQKCEDGKYSAWHLAKDKPSIREVMMTYLPGGVNPEDDDIKSEPEDEFESADENEMPEGGLTELSQYVSELCPILDASESWRRLATRFQLQHLYSWYANTSSPTRTLLNYLKECGNNITSKTLATILDEIGEREAANIIRRYID